MKKLIASLGLLIFAAAFAAGIASADTNTLNSKNINIVQYGSFTTLDAALRASADLSTRSKRSLIERAKVNSNTVYRVYEVLDQSITTTTQPTPTTTTVSSGNNYQIQYGVFSNQQNAYYIQQQLRKDNVTTSIAKTDTGYHKVLGDNVFGTKAQAEKYIREKGLTNVLVVSTSKAATTTTNSTPPAATSNSKFEYGIQYGAFTTYNNAKSYSTNLDKQGIKTIIYQFPDDTKKLYRVLSQAPFTSREAASSFLKKNNLNNSQATILTFVKN